MFRSAIQRIAHAGRHRRLSPLLVVLLGILLGGIVLPGAVLSQTGPIYLPLILGGDARTVDVRGEILLRPLQVRADQAAAHADAPRSYPDAYVRMVGEWVAPGDVPGFILEIPEFDTGSLGQVELRDARDQVRYTASIVYAADSGTLTYLFEDVQVGTYYLHARLAYRDAHGEIFTYQYIFNPDDSSYGLRISLTITASDARDPVIVGPVLYLDVAAGVCPEPAPVPTPAATATTMPTLTPADPPAADELTLRGRSSSARSSLNLIVRRLNTSFCSIPAVR